MRLLGPASLASSTSPQAPRKALEGASEGARVAASLTLAQGLDWDSAERPPLSEPESISDMAARTVPCAEHHETQQHTFVFETHKHFKRKEEEGRRKVVGTRFVHPSSLSEELGCTDGVWGVHNL